MRTITGTYGNISYPDAICFAFNPMLIKVTGNSYDKITVTVKPTSQGTGYTETRYPNSGGECWMDMESYAQGFFDKSNWGNLSPSAAQLTGLGMTVYYTVKLYSGNNVETHDLNSYVIWGSMVSGEEYNGYRRLKWFTNFPFSIGLYAGASSTIALCNDGSPTTTKTLNSSGVWKMTCDEFSSRLTSTLTPSDSSVSIIVLMS